MKMKTERYNQLLADFLRTLTDEQRATAMERIQMEGMVPLTIAIEELGCSRSFLEKQLETGKLKPITFGRQTKTKGGNDGRKINHHLVNLVEARALVEANSLIAAPRPRKPRLMEVPDPTPIPQPAPAEPEALMDPPLPLPDREKVRPASAVPVPEGELSRTELEDMATDLTRRWESGEKVDIGIVRERAHKTFQALVRELTRRGNIRPPDGITDMEFWLPDVDDQRPTAPSTLRRLGSR